MPDLLDLPSYTDPAAIAPPEPQRKPDNSEMTLREYIDTAGDRIGVPKQLRDAIYGEESNFSHYEAPGVVKRGRYKDGRLSGALGVSQLMPATAARHGVDINDPIQNAYGGLKEQKRLYDKYITAGNSPNEAALLAAAAYNAGEGAVEKYHGIPPFEETQGYVSQIGKKLKKNPIQSGAAMTAPVAQEATSQAKTQPAPSSAVTPEVLAGGYLPHAQPGATATGITPETQSAQPDSSFYGLENAGVTEGVHVAEQKNAQDKAAVDTAFGNGVWDWFSAHLKPEERAAWVQNAQHMNTISDVTRLGEELGKEQDAARRATIRRERMRAKVQASKANQERNSIIEAGRAEMISEAANQLTEVMKHTDPINAPRTQQAALAGLTSAIMANPADVVKYMRDRGMRGGLDFNRPAPGVDTLRAQGQRFVQSRQPINVSGVQPDRDGLKAAIRQQVLAERPHGKVSDSPGGEGGQFTSDAPTDVEDEVKTRYDQMQAKTKENQRLLGQMTPEQRLQFSRDVDEHARMILGSNWFSAGLSWADLRAKLYRLTAGVSDFTNTLAAGEPSYSSKERSQAAATTDRLRTRALALEEAVGLVERTNDIPKKTEALRKVFNIVGDLAINSPVMLTDPILGFGLMSAAQARGHNLGWGETAKQAAVGAATGAAFKAGEFFTPAGPGVLEQGKALGKQAATIGAGTFGVEYAAGTPAGQALESAITNIGLHTFFRASKIAREAAATGAARVLGSESAPEWAKRAAEWWTNYQQDQAEAGPREGQTKSEWRANYAQQQAKAESAINDIREGRISPEAKAFYAGIEPRWAGTTIDKVAAFAKELGIPWEPDPRWVAAENPTPKTAPTERSESPSPKEPPAPAVEPAREPSAEAAQPGTPETTASIPSLVYDNATEHSGRDSYVIFNGSQARSIFESPSIPQESPKTAETKVEPTPPGEKHPVTGRKYTSTQVDLPPEFAKLQQQAAAQIPDSELSEDGRESNAHITVKYGLRTENPADVRDLLAGEGPIKAKVGKVSIFPASGDRNYDVVKMEVASPDLHRLNKKIATNLKVTDTHPEYKPHITLAYVKAGEGKKYVGKSNALTGKTITIDKLTFSGRGGQEEVIPLKGVSDAETVRSDEGSIRGGRAEGKSEVQSSADQGGKDLQLGTSGPPAKAAQEPDTTAGALKLKELRDAGVEVLNPDEVSQGGKPKIRVQAEAREQPKELARITPRQIVRHSDPNIDGGEVVGRFPDGDLKVQNKEGGISRVRDPRREGNREAAVAKVEPAPKRESVSPRRGIQIKTPEQVTSEVSGTPQDEGYSLDAEGTLLDPDGQPLFSKIAEYQGEHEAPMKEDGAPLHDLTSGDIYPEDIYSYDARRLYSAGNEDVSTEIEKLRADTQPNKMAVPGGSQPGLGFGDSEGLLAEGGPQPISEVRSDSAKPKQIAELNRKHVEFQREREQEVFGSETANRLTSLAETKDRVGKIAQTILNDRRMASRPDSENYIQSLVDAMETVRGAQAAELPLTDYLRQDSLFGEPISSEVAELAHGIEAGNFRFMEESRPLMMAPAFHGSPHEFDKFSSEKIGSGEGAQAYGYGLYFTDKEEIANEYKNRLSQTDGRPVYKMYLGDSALKPATNWEEELLRSLEIDAAVASYSDHPTVDDIVTKTKATLDRNAFTQSDRERAEKKKAILDRWVANGLDVRRYTGRLYHVELKPSDDEYLLWDKPLAEQPDRIKHVLQSVQLMKPETAKSLLQRETAITETQNKVTQLEQRVEELKQQTEMPKEGDLYASSGTTYIGKRLYVTGKVYEAKPRKSDGVLTWRKSDEFGGAGGTNNKKFFQSLKSKAPHTWSDDANHGQIVTPQLTAKARAAKEKIDSVDLPEARKHLDNAIGATGKSLYNSLVKAKGSPEAASKYLHSLGIRGNKYLTGQSRSKGGGDYNYVIFSDDDVRIQAMFNRRVSPSQMLDSLKAIDDDTELIRNLKSSREADIVWVNPEGQELLRRMESESSSGFFGIQLDRDSAIPILRDLKTGSQALRAASLSSTAIDALHRQIVDAIHAGKGHALVVMEGESSETAIKHESFHQGSALGAAEKPLADRHTSENQERLHSMAAVAKWRRYFQRTPGLTNASKALAIEETAAEIAGDGGQRIGLTEQESADFIYEWAKSFYETNGPKAFEAFRRQEDHVNKAIEAAKRVGYQVEAQKSLASGKTVRGRKGSARGQPESSVSEVRPPAPGLGRRIELRGQGEVREASLPETLSVAGLDTEGLYYQGFTDAQGRSDAAELLERHGIEGSLRLLKDTPNPGKEHAVLSFMVQRLLLDQAATASSQGNEAEASRLRSEQQELAAAHASHATHSGQFNQAAASAGVSVETALTVAQRIVQNEYGSSARVNPKIAGRIEEHARAAEQAFGETMALTVELGELRKRVAQLERERGTRNPRNAVRIQLEAEEQGLINVVVKAFTIPPGAPVKMAVPAELSTEAREALAKLGVLELIRNPDGSIEDWNTALRGKIGEGVEPYLVEAYTDAFALRRTMLKEAREAAVINEFHKSHPDATEDELADYLETQKTARERAKLASGEKATKTRLLIRINELKTLIETGEKFVKGQAATNQDIELLKSERDRLQGVVDEMAGPKVTPEDKRIELATKAVKKSIADYDKRIVEGRVTTEPKSDVAPWSEELGRLQSQRADLRKQLNKIRKQANAPTKQRNAIAAQLKSVTKSIGELETRIQAGNIASRAPGTPKPTNPQIEAAKAQRKILAKLLADMRRAARPRKVKTVAEKEAARHLAVTRIIGELAPSNIIAETAGKILFGNKTAYSDLLDAGIPKGEAIGIVKQAREIVSRAKQQAERERLAKIVEAQQGRKVLDDEIDRVATERLLAKKRGSEARAELARDLNNITKPWYGKVWDVGVDISNSSRSSLAAGDFSFLLRQGGFLMTAYPEQQGEALKRAYEAFTQIGELRAKDAMEHHARFGQALQAGIDFASLGREEGSLVKGEEIFRGDLAKKIPGWGHVVKFSDRTYAVFLDSQRLITFAHLAADLEAMGYTFRENPKAFRDIARLINVATGRGHLLGFKSNQLAKIIMNLPYFSARNLISRFQLLNLTLNPVAYARLSPGARYIVARTALRTYGTLAILAGLAALLGFKIILDWEDDDFGKLRVGNTRFDLSFGLVPAARHVLRLTQIAARFASGRQRYAGESAADTVSEVKRFHRTKIAPGPAFFWDMFAGENFRGQAFKLYSKPRTDKSTAENIRRFMFEGAIAERIWFLPVQDIQQAWHEGGFGAALMTAPASVTGIGVNTYKDNPMEPHTAAERLAAKLARPRPGTIEEPETEEKSETRDRLSDLRARAMKNEDVKSELDKMVQSGEISNAQAKNVEGAKGLSKLEYWVRKLPPDQALLVVKEGSPTERRELLPLLYGKVQRAAPGSVDAKTQTDMAKLSPDLAKLFEQRKPVESELIKHDMKFPEANATISIGNREIKLTGDKLLNYQKRVDALVYERLPKIIQSSEYQSADPSIQKKMLQEAQSIAHGLATAEIKTELAPSDRILAGQLRREQVRSQKLGTNTKVMRLRSERRQEVQERIHPQP